MNVDLVMVESEDGTRWILALPSIPSDADITDRQREGIARQRITAISGLCPCGARMVPPNREQRRQARRSGYVHTTVEHETGCPAGEVRIV